MTLKNAGFDDRQIDFIGKIAKNYYSIRIENSKVEYFWSNEFLYEAPLDLLFFGLENNVPKVFLGMKITLLAGICEVLLTIELDK